jgi:hypothetical protein
MKNLPKTIILSTITAAILISTANLLPIKAQIIDSEISPILFNRTKLPPRGTPGDRIGGGTRRTDLQVIILESEDLQCPDFTKDNPVFALVPKETENNLSYVGGLTVNPSPTLWFYLPYSPNLIQKGELKIWDKTNPNPRRHQLIYSGNFTPNATPGIIGLNIPSEIQLKPDQKYEWKIEIISNCETQPITIHGQIGVVSDLILPENLTPREQAITYAQEGIWHDSLTILSQLILDNPNDATAVNDWQKLLTDVGLENLIEAPIIPCCQLEPNSN